MRGHKVRTQIYFLNLSLKKSSAGYKTDDTKLIVMQLLKGRYRVVNILFAGGRVGNWGLTPIFRFLFYIFHSTFN
jgi:hypothetical protein